jgi:hypothetical protein
MARLGPGIRGVEFPVVASTRPWKSPRRRQPGELPPSVIAGGAAATSSCLRGRRQVRYRCAVVGVRKMPRKNFEVVARLDYSWKSVLFHMQDFSTMIQKVFFFFCPWGSFQKVVRFKSGLSLGSQVWISVPKLGISANIFPKRFHAGKMMKIGGLISCFSLCFGF